LLALAVPTRLPAADDAPAAGKVVLSCPDEPDLNAQLPAVQTYLETHTGWAFRRNVRIVRKRPDAGRGEQGAGPTREEAEKEREERRQVFIVFKAFGLISSVFEAEKAYDLFIGRALVGSYNEDDETLTIIGKGFDLNVIVHELHHALAHQNLGSLKSFRGGPKADPERDMARLSLVEGAAMVAERSFPAWVQDKARGVPSPQTLSSIRDGLLREIRQTYLPPDNRPGRVATGERPEELYAVQTDLLFPYTWGTYYCTRFLSGHQGDWQRRYRELFDPAKAPRTTREIIRGEAGDPPPGSPPVALGEVIDRWVEANPKWKSVGHPGRVGELMARLWTGTGILPEAAITRPGLGADEDWFAVVQVPGREGPNEVAGLATLTFGSEAEAERFVGRFEAAGPETAGPGDVVERMARLGRIVVAPLGRCPASLFAAGVEAARKFELPVPPATVDGAIAELELYRDHGEPGGFERAAAAVARVVDAGEPAAVAAIGRALFLPARDLRKADEENLGREVELGRRLARELAGRPSPAGRVVLARAAIAALEGQGVAPVQRLSAARYLIAARDGLGPDDRRRAAAAVAETFAGRPNLARSARSALDPDPETHRTERGPR
jgi:hypothetical protein